MHIRTTLSDVTFTWVANMGVFDWVRYAGARCYACDLLMPATRWQSKDHDREARVLDADAVSRFYATCPRCNCWNEYVRTGVGFIRDGLASERIEAQYHATDRFWLEREAWLLRGAISRAQRGAE